LIRRNQGLAGSAEIVKTQSQKEERGHGGTREQ
jgi:hypothetical protein